MQFADIAGPDQPSQIRRADQGLRCPFTELIDTVVYIYVNEQRMSGQDCMDAHAHLDLVVRKGNEFRFATLCTKYHS